VAATRCPPPRSPSRQSCADRRATPPHESAPAPPSSARPPAQSATGGYAPQYGSDLGAGTRYFSSTHVIPLAVSQSQASVPPGRWPAPHSLRRETPPPPRPYSFPLANRPSSLAARRCDVDPRLAGDQFFGSVSVSTLPASLQPAHPAPPPAKSVPAMSRRWLPHRLLRAHPTNPKHKTKSKNRSLHRNLRSRHIPNARLAESRVYGCLKRNSSSCRRGNRLS